jgi:proteic killer suppression protein
MILTFRCPDTAALFAGQRVARFVNFENVAIRKLAMLNRAQSLNDLRIPPKNQLEALQRDRVGQHSIRVNDQYRVCFRFDAGNAFDVEIVDYH